MQTHTTTRSAILAVVLLITFIISWELYLRHKGVIADYDDGPELWADKRAMVYEPADKATVFIGSSRIKYDLDIPTWESLAGTHAIQLAMTGSTPVPMLDDLANDPKFKGSLIVDVTEILFFNKAPYFLISPAEGIGYYKKRTPAQQASFLLDKPVEANLAFLNSAHLSINGMLDHAQVKDRPGVYPTLDFPIDFEPTMFNRQNKMTDRFVADTNLQNQVKGIWAMLGKDPSPPMSGKELDAFMQNIKSDVDKIKARGGSVIFVRTPSNPPMYIGESMGYPRKLYWDRLLATTGCKGIYFADYPATAHLVCPEWSHLDPKSAITYTKALVSILKQQEGWNLKMAANY
ncbi:hypothetical protein HQ865_10795 [Mucilaginibacter mali]|uniref:Uncharacterized protein n=1 Tax=Mucilaginibacter mali TaxID=2740462 RepID=A0A7D4QK60_9SPHI|nr:hypothetical protein [Mucilaginibacter mali]QKJ30230.1 hypothetical protein HQ865_10795 [Mucilaginibacter mali]